MIHVAAQPLSLSQPVLNHQAPAVRAVAKTVCVSVIVPTYREAQSLPHLLARLDRVRQEHRFELDVHIMDDFSDDGSREVVEAAGLPWVHFHERQGTRGLSPAVLDGLTLALSPVLVVMDADLSHPPEVIAPMVAALDEGAEFVVGSRYIRGGSTDTEWTLYRRLNSRIATLLARPLTRLHDPMSGFFAFRRSLLDSAGHLNPIGYKIGLELLVKCDAQHVAEVPIHFADRVHGESKLTLAQQLRYIQHLRRLYLFRYAEATHVAQFLVVGASGVVVNLGVLTIALGLGAERFLALALGILVSVIGNFLLHRRFTFSYARRGPRLGQFAGYCVACLLTAGASFLTSIAMSGAVPDWPLQVAALAGIAVGTGLNYLLGRFVVFRK
ncbi:MAG: glycosyltransferase family 2 protein [Phycisphaerales bacterium]|nr:glycosyltransferase family 2 protein [Phycisphaerales bacterium]